MNSSGICGIEKLNAFIRMLRMQSAIEYSGASNIKCTIFKGSEWNNICQAFGYVESGLLSSG